MMIILMPVLICPFVIGSTFGLQPNVGTKNCSQVVVNEADIFHFFQQNANNVRSWQKPVKNFNTSVGVKVVASVSDIVGVNEKEKQLSIHTYVYLYWNDENHVWNETWPFNCVSSVVMNHGVSTGIWIPYLAFSDA